MCRTAGHTYLYKTMTINYKLIEDSIETVPDFPHEGIMFRDITSLISNPAAFQESVNALVAQYKDKGITKVVGAESRGFIFGAPVALAFGVPFVLARKAGKLPRATVKQEYSLEYGTAALELHEDAISEGDNVLVIDDLIATGGTIGACIELIRKLGGEVKHAGFIINLKDLPGKAKLEGMGVEVFSLVEYEGE